jgi:hypothetical protein
VSDIKATLASSTDIPFDQIAADAVGYGEGMCCCAAMNIRTAA